MKTFSWSIKWVAVCCCLVLLFSCTKTIDTSRDSVSLTTSNDLTFPTTNEFSDCKLRRIVHISEYNPETTVNMLFTYNAAGNPFSVTRSKFNDAQNYYFYYDRKNRLKELRIAHHPEFNDEYTESHRYGYDNNNVIVVDTVLHPSVADSDTVVRLGVHKIITLTYDSQGRIVKENIKDVLNGTTRNPTYTYDARGNLGVAGWKSSSYDNKVSIFRAHPIFQFIHRNYSRNNGGIEARYNSKGLPLTVKQLNDNFFGAVGYTTRDIPYPLEGISKAIYDCQ